MKEYLVEVGTVRKTHGYKGELKIATHSGYEDDLLQANFLFLGSSAKTALPYKVAERRGDQHIYALEGLSSKEQAASLRGELVLLPQSQVSYQPDEEDTGGPDEEAAAEYARFLGFALVDEDLGEIGAIQEVVAYPSQAMARVVHGKRSVLVPLNPNLIVGVDFTKKMMFVDLPKGLLDL